MMLSNKKLRMIIIIILLMIFCYFIGIYKPKADTLSIDTDMGVIYSDNANIINQPNSSTTWNWGYNYNNLGRVDGIEIYLHSNSGDFVTYNNYLTFMIGGTSITNQPNALASNPFSIGGAVLKVQGASYMCSVDSNNASVVNEDTTGGTSTGVESVTSWSATINCDVSSGINIGTSDNFASLWIQGNSIGVFNYTGFKIYMHKNAYYSSSKIFGNSQAIQNIQNDTSDIKDSIKDSNIDDSSSSTNGFSNTTNSSMSNTPVSNLIALPITFLTGVNNAISSSCTNVNYIELFNYQLVLPCLNLSERLGDVWVIIDTIVSCMLLFSIGKSLVSTFARLSDMDTNIMYECYANGKDHRGESF